MLAALLARLGLQALAPLALPLLAYLVLGGGAAGFVWWNQLADMPTALLAALSGGVFLAAIVTQSLLTRVSLGLVALVLALLAGIVNEQGRTEVQLDNLKTSHELELAKLNQAMRDKVELERQRQIKVNTEALKKAMDAQAQYDQERARLAEERAKLLKEAADDKDADRPALGVDAVDRINRLRHEPRVVRPGGKRPAARSSATGT